MKQQQHTTGNTPLTFKKKVYSKPVLTILGEAAVLTAGGSNGRSEFHGYHKGKHGEPGKPKCDNGRAHSISNRC